MKNPTPNPTIYPTDLAEMSVAQLAALPPAQKLEIDANLIKAIDWLKKARSKFDSALDLAYGERARFALRESGRDFGTVHLTDGALHLEFVLPKKVVWDQKKLTELAQRIATAGERPEHYLDIKFSMSETRYAKLRDEFAAQFADARTVDEGKPAFTLTIEGGAS